MNSCSDKKILDAVIYETSESGNKLTEITDFSVSGNIVEITILPEEKYQTIIGFGGSFTEASAYNLTQISLENRKKIIEAYFGESGAKYSLTRTHIGSCDFSLGNYTFAPVENDLELKHFSIDEDKNDIIPFIKDAKAVSKDGFKIISSPWTAPPWMKDNNEWNGGKLLPKYYDTWSLYFSKYLQAYKSEGIDIFGITVENEPLGNDNNWESMIFTPQEMNDFVKNHLCPKLKTENLDIKILGFDQNRDAELKKWVDVMFASDTTKNIFDGTAIHWYASTFDYFPEALQYAHQKAPEKLLIQTEACIDAQVPKWKNDAWYWSEEATDWGYTWAKEEDKHLHPKYIPVFRYAGDIIGCLNNWVNGWIDWNMVLDRQGGPNHAKNWCIAPVIVDAEKDEVYFTPLYYTLSHFSRYIRPNAVRIGFKNSDNDLQITAVENTDGSIAVVIFNPKNEKKSIKLKMKEKYKEFSISEKAIQTLVIFSD